MVRPTRFPRRGQHLSRRHLRRSRRHRHRARRRPLPQQKRQLSQVLQVVRRRNQVGAGRASGDPLSFTTLLTPSALAYDSVSKRYVIADRSARRIAIIDENTGQVSTLAGIQAALGEIGGIAIDPLQGDLWVVSVDDGSTSLHKLQLISGRVVSTIPVTGAKAPIVAMTFVRGAGLVAADASGALSGSARAGRSNNSPTSSTSRGRSRQMPPHACTSHLEDQSLPASRSIPDRARAKCSPCRMKRCSTAESPSSGTGCTCWSSARVVSKSTRYRCDASAL